MRRFYAMVIGVALLMATPGLANARPAVNQQAVDFVISRALSQRGVPFNYGGGNSSGPSMRPDSVPTAVGMEQRATTLSALPGAGILSPEPQPEPNVVGFDASGLMVYAFAGAGIKLPRSSGEQYKVAQKIDPSQALPGDLIFFGPDGTQSVALFLGNGQMLEATEPVVTVSPVRTATMTPYLGRIIA
jgi:cell wall-associated NlpC family hydrolase